jgi:hypothetical protein
MPWRSVHYTVSHQDGVPDFAVQAELGAPTPFVRQKLSFLQQLLGAR